MKNRIIIGINEQIEEMQKKIEEVSMLNFFQYQVDNVRKEMMVQIENFEKITCQNLKQMEEKLEKEEQFLTQKCSSFTDEFLSLNKIVENFKNRDNAIDNSTLHSEKSKENIDENKLILSLEKIYQSLILESRRRIVEFPKLYKRLEQNYPNLTIQKFKEILQKLCDKEVIDLHSANNISEVEHSNFSISSPLGDFYYVSWR